MDSQVEEVLSFFGNVCSIGGLIVTAFVFWKLRRIQRSFLFQARLPALTKRLGTNRSQLIKLLNTFPDTMREVEAEIRKCRANLGNLHTKLSQNEAVSVKSVLDLTKRVGQSTEGITRDEVWEVCLALTGLEEELGNLSQDAQWRPRQ